MAGPSGPRRRGTSHVGPLDDLGKLAMRRRLMLGLTQYDLADLAGVGASSVRALEAGRETLTVAVMLRILDALGLALAVAPQSDLSALSTAALLHAPALTPTAGLHEWTAPNE